MAVKSVQLVSLIGLIMIDILARFFERIAKTYRREKWSWMLRPLLVSWYACAKEIDAVDLSAKLLLEMISYGLYREHISQPHYWTHGAYRGKAR